MTAAVFFPFLMNIIFAVMNGCLACIAAQEKREGLAAFLLGVCILCGVAAGFVLGAA